MSKTHPRIPDERNARQEMRTAAREAIASLGLQPPADPLTIAEHASHLIAKKKWSPELRLYLGCHIANELWRDTILAVAPHERLLLLPTDRDATRCSALAELACGRGMKVITIDDRDTIASALLNANHRAVIAVGEFELIQQGWSKIAPLAIPAAAIPLVDNQLQDSDWAEEFLGDAVQNSHEQFDFNSARGAINNWFQHDAITQLITSGGSETEEIGIAWLAAAGKRWRPLLCYYIYTILSGDTSQPDAIKKIALAVECFHKASLVHDDIEDDDDTRYGKPTMHVEHGLPIALNVGDYLIGEGYCMIGESQFDPEKIQRMLKVAAEGHRDLCLGQGEELCWMRRPTTIDLDKVINIFRLKTSPAFEVALCLGAIAGGEDDTQCAILKEFSTALGIAFQIRDDMLDFFGDDGGADIAAMRPSALLAMVRQECSPAVAQIIDDAWQSKSITPEQQKAIQTAAKDLDLQPTAIELLEKYKERAVTHLSKLKNYEIQKVLKHVIAKIV